MNKEYVILSEHDSACIRSKLELELYKTMKNGWSPYWYPLKDIKDNIDVIAFDSDYWNDNDNMKLLLNIFKSCNVKKVYTLQECSNVYVYKDFLNKFGLMEQDEDGYILPYMSEQYVWDKSHKWMIYTSHEATITFAGKIIVDAIKNALLCFPTEEIDIGNNKCCPYCGKVTWHIIHIKNIFYQCPICKRMYKLK